VVPAGQQVPPDIPVPGPGQWIWSDWQQFSPRQQWSSTHDIPFGHCARWHWSMARAYQRVATMAQALPAHCGPSVVPQWAVRLSYWSLLSDMHFV
jgi:hypothetical protein